jgi:beta-glucuronidase
LPTDELFWKETKMNLAHDGGFPLRNYLLTFVLCACPGWLAATTRIDLHADWHFCLDPRSEGEKLGWTAKLPDATEAVRIPHTWNIGTHDDYEGLAWYFRSFVLDRALSGQHVEIHFGATFYKSRVWLNGIAVGGHEGGHTAYDVDLTAAIRPGRNFLAVEIDNRPTTSSIPGLAMKLGGSNNIWYDWWHYGGIVREVYLAVADTAFIRRQKIASEVTGSQAVVTTTVFLDGFARGGRKLTLSAEARGPDGSIVASAATVTADLPPGGHTQVRMPLRMAAVHLWSVDHPEVYSMTVAVNDSEGRVLDTKTDTFGFRTIRIADRHLLVNGERVRLTGLTRHEESPWEGLAETEGTILHDWEDLKELHVTLTRPVHYPQNKLILDYADRHGIFLIPEIPVWQFDATQLADPKFVSLAKQMMREMIEQDANHPCILAWSVSNESAMSTVAGKAYLRTMKSLIHELDPGRLVTFADNELSYGVDAKASASNEADFIMMNEYFGAWNGPEEGLAPLLDRIERDFPEKMFIVSEFGTPGVFARDSVEADKLRVHIIRNQLAEFARRDWIAGAILWCYQDYKSHRNLWPGQKEGYVDHGVVDENRQRRPSFETWKQLNEPARISAAWTAGHSGLPTGFVLKLKRRNPEDLPSYPMKNYTVEWEVRDSSGRLWASDNRNVPDLQTEVTIARELASTIPAENLILNVRLLEEGGKVVADKRLTYLRLNPGGQDVPDMSPELRGRIPQL